MFLFAKLAFWALRLLLEPDIQKARIQIWLFEQKDLRIEGRIIGFDEYMNLVLDDAEEVNIKKKSRKQLGRILLKGDNITLMMNT
ncbi:LSM domain, eukaryotic/archaea-type [Dillenia turbinata]|uniref:Small nuclear ribonucleoprotein E n=1 Tax=Dillenia turbinata TaxID=194707 RepID=A0AAN8WD36_9MAGN